MALFPKTPGVYIEEIPRFPSSVAAVPTSVPVFLGYTKQAVIDGVQATSYPTNPVRIESLLQYQTIFGGPEVETFGVVLTGPNVDIAASKTTATPARRLFYNMQMYFANGGGPCYIVSVGNYSATPAALDFTNGIEKAEQVDEITMLIAPESILLNTAGRLIVNDAMLAHCSKMQDRFALLDVLTNTSQTIALDAEDFRDDAVGANNLSYGAAYYPSFDSALPFNYGDINVSVNATAVNLPPNVLAFQTTTLNVINNGIQQVNNLDLNLYTLGEGSLNINGIIFSLSTATVVQDVVDLINSNAGTYVTAFIFSTLNIHVTAVTAGVVITPITYIPSGTSTITITPVLPLPLAPDKLLYNRIKEAIDALPMELYPSSTMAGIYCAVDSARGVWKAPANVSVALVESLNRNIKDSDQSDLNVDATSGKSIDVIREFPGRGKLVWGARTLDGNSNEWRYISVRRTFLFIEDSCKKATMFSVFEPNDKSTWLRIQGMISSFLTTIWRDGGLAGSKPEQAFFVKVGLGETMTAQDILEGRLIVQIGLAVVRPAEFIILQFEHKLQEA